MLQHTSTVVLLYAVFIVITQGIAEEFSPMYPTVRPRMPPAFWDLRTDAVLRNNPGLLLYRRRALKKAMASTAPPSGIEKHVKMPDSSSATSPLSANDSLQSTGSRRNPVHTLETAPVINYAEKSPPGNLLTPDGGDSTELNNPKIYLDPHVDLGSTLDLKAEEDVERRDEVNLFSASRPVAVLLRDVGLRRQKRDEGDRNAVEGRRFSGRIIDVRGRYRPTPPSPRRH
ncbi:uncharacterized protein LOC124159095 [Ischnura elegans]|uniref:uncharacterized protein LOC124159095 n=1 Tax=Ischnura elegans TaxID=197161 RepID=UPI001ED885D8|nr:uncharacterized protein LOC124159095 [Ischnura elegans]